MRHQRNYKFFDTDIPSCCYTKAIKRGGTVIRLPLFWIYQDVYIYYPDYYIELKQVLFNSNNNAYINVGSVYEGQTLLCRLKNKIPYKVNMNRYI